MKEAKIVITQTPLRLSFLGVAQILKASTQKMMVVLSHLQLTNIYM